MSKYNTAQKEKIREIIKKQTKPFYPKDIYELIDGVGLTTIYREISFLEEKGLLKKTIHNNKTQYEYLTPCDNNNHFYLKCDTCGKITHVDCNFIDKLKKHIYNDHLFKLNDINLVLNGTCDECNRKDI